MMTDTLVSAEFIRKDIYHCLAKLFQLPDDDVEMYVTGLKNNLVLIEPDAIQIRDIDCLLQTNPDQDLLLIEYSRLFLGPYQVLAPPYGSVYMDGQNQVMGESTQDVVRQYRESGLEISSSFNNPPDHLCAELEYLEFLVHKSIAASEIGDLDEMYSLVNKQISFLTSHPGTWVPEFADRIAGSANLEFYRALTSVTLAFLDHDLAHLIQNKIDLYRNQS
jgi:TorA maturation chaperone TorD